MKMCTLTTFRSYPMTATQSKTFMMPLFSGSVSLYKEKQTIFQFSLSFIKHLELELAVTIPQYQTAR